MANWSSPVFDRTQADVDYAKKQIRLGNNSSVLKGCFNFKDINRIESNCRYIADVLNELLYTNSITTKAWVMSRLPDVSEIERLINNAKELIKAFHQSPDAPPLPETLLTFEQVNALERNLYLIKHLIDNAESEFRYCGTFNCGEGL